MAGQAQVPVYTPTVYDLATVAEVVDYINPNLGQADQNKLQLYLTGASRWIGRILSRNLPIATYNELRNGQDTQVMKTINYPISVVFGVSILSTNGNATQLPYFTFDAEFVYARRGERGTFFNGVFPHGFQNIQISYQAGFYTPGQSALGVAASGITLPEDLKLACLELVALYYRKRDRVGDTSTGIGPERINFDMKAIPNSTKDILNWHRNVAPVGLAGPGY